MEDIYGFIRSAWVVWMLILFVAIVVWVLWPSNRKLFRNAAQIPFSDEPTTTSGRENKAKQARN